MRNIPSAFSRRQWLTASAATAAGLGMLRDAVSQENNAAANVADRGADIKISGLRGFRVGTKAYIKIETNKGIVGWGEVTGLEPNIAVALAQSLYELLDGENPTRIEHLWQKVYRSHRDMRGGSFMTHVLSAIDCALWDITGRAWGVPVYRLLGGPVRDKVRVYPSPKAHKNGTGGPHEFSGTPKEVQRLVNMVKETRARLGEDGAVMFDAHCAMPPPLLIQFANMIESQDVLFIEEVAVPGNIEVFKRIKEQVRVPIAVGERDRTIWGMIPYLQEGCVDILQPDCAHTGGITQMRKIATLAEAYYVPLAPHCTCSQLGLTSSLHAAFATPLFLIHEAYLDGHIMPAGVANVTWKVDADGYASLPQEPGLGVTIDESQFDKVNADPQRKFKWPTPKAPDGAVIDY